VPTLFTFPHFSEFNIFRNIQNVDDGGFRGPAATFSGCPPRQTKSPPFWSGWLLFCSSDCALFALFCFTIIVIVCIPPASTNLVFFLSFFLSLTSFLWLLVVAYCSLLIGILPWFLLPFLGGIGLGGAPMVPRRHRPPIHRRCSCLVPPPPCSSLVLILSRSLAALAVLLLGSSVVLLVLLIGLSSAVLLIGLASVFLASAVLRTKPLSSVLVLLLGSWCFSAAPHETFGVLFFSKFLCCYLCHSIHVLQFTNSTSTPFPFSTLPFPFRLFHFPFDSSISLSTLPFPFRLSH
jgi:hypothetical protein